MLFLEILSKVKGWHKENKNWFCKLFGHDFHIAMNSEEMWIICSRKSCRHEEDIPKDREEEAYQKIRNRDWSWKK